MFFLTMRVLTRSLKRMVTILRKVWGGSWGRGAPPSDSGIEPEVIQNVGTGAFPGGYAIGQGALIIHRSGLRRKILRVKFPARKRTFGKPRYDMSPIPSATPPTLNPVRQGVEYPPWPQVLERAVNGLMSSFESSGVGNGFIAFPVMATLDLRSGRGSDTEDRESGSVPPHPRATAVPSTGRNYP